MPLGFVSGDKIPHNIQGGMRSTNDEMSGSLAWKVHVRAGLTLQDPGKCVCPWEDYTPTHLSRGIIISVYCGGEGN